MTMEASVLATCAAAHQEVKLDWPLIQLPLPMCKEQTPSHPPRQQRDLCCCSLWVYGFVGESRLQGDSQLCSVTSGRAWTCYGGDMATQQLGGTSLPLFSMCVWSPVVPRRLQVRLGSTLHDEKSHQGGFHVSLKYCSLFIRKVREANLRHLQKCSFPASSAHTFAWDTAGEGGRPLVTLARGWGLECVCVCVCVCQLSTLPSMLDATCLVLSDAQALDDLLLAHPSPHLVKILLYKKLLSNPAAFSSKASCSELPAVFILCSSSESTSILKLFSYFPLPFSLIHFYSLNNFCRGLCSDLYQFH